MSAGALPLLAATDVSDLLGVVVFVLVVLAQVLKPAKKKPGASAPRPAPRPTDTSRSAPAAEPMTRAERSAPPTPGPDEGTSRNAPAAEPMRRPERAPVTAPRRPGPRPTAPARPRAPLTPQAPAESRRQQEARRQGPDALGVSLPTAEDMPGAHSAAHHEHLVDLGATSLKSSRHPGKAPTAAAAPKQRQFANRGRALLGAGLEGRDRLRGAMAWSIVLGRPKAATFGRPSHRP